MLFVTNLLFVTKILNDIVICYSGQNWYYYSTNNLVPTNKIDDIQIANPSSKKNSKKKYYLKMLNQNKLNTSIVLNFF